MDDAGDDPRPLAGIRVIDLTHLLAGPYATMMLADNGADVIKIEPPSGEISRHRVPARRSADGSTCSGYFLAMNRGKRSVVIDLKTAEGQQALAALVATADVLVENFRPGVLERFGLDLTSLLRQYPRLIVASLSAFGQEDVASEVRDVPGVAIVAEAASGIAGLSRDRDGRPVWCGWALGDLVGGLTLYAAIASALFRRARTGRGGRLDLSMTESVLAMYGPALGMHAAGGRQAAESIPPAVPFGLYPAADGFVAIGVNSEQFWRRLCAALDVAHLAEDPRFRTYSDRLANLPEVEGLVEAWTRTRSRAEVCDHLRSYGVPCALVAGPEDVLRDGTFAARGALWSVTDGIGGTAVLPADPLRFARVPPGPVPRLGQHTDEVLDEVRTARSRR